MNKEQLEEALKIVKEPITVNSIEYKYFDIENYNKLVQAIDYCNYLNANVKPYVEAQDKEIERLNKECDTYMKIGVNKYNIIDKAIDKLYCYGEVFDSKILQQFQKEMLDILKGENNNE